MKAFTSARFFSLSLLAVFAFGCSPSDPPSSFTLNGRLPKAVQSNLYLLAADQTPVDSVRSNGADFVFKGNLTEPGLYAVRIDTFRKTYPVFLEQAPIRMEIHDDETYAVSGSKLHSEWDQYENRFIAPIRDELVRLYSEKTAAQAKGDTALVSRLKKQNDSVSIYFFTHRQNFITRRPFTFFNLYLLGQYWENLGEEFTAAQLAEFKGQMGHYATFARLDQELKKRTARRQATEPGQAAFNFTLPDSSGAMHRLKSPAKKLVVVDFWASWCGPCLKQVPALKRLHTAYAGQGLTVIGISIDDNERQWKQALRRHRPAGLQLLAGTNQEVKDRYAITEIPQTYLIDQQGRIVARNLEEAALQKKVAVLLGK
ncbi:TlpA disulfide reductase family protein [Larkinella soli]|uniref:TlpA disulfide reductase family protein n=1 Tax=Larkinella soli TaxID=1770527 RepID=UPI0013E28C18|nr:TlpA disulfide reductase family protein [Larkinella soli]